MVIKLAQILQPIHYFYANHWQFVLYSSIMISYTYGCRLVRDFLKNRGVHVSIRTLLGVIAGFIGSGCIISIICILPHVNLVAPRVNITSDFLFSVYFALFVFNWKQLFTDKETKKLRRLNFDIRTRLIQGEKPDVITQELVDKGISLEKASQIVAALLQTTRKPFIPSAGYLLAFLSGFFLIWIPIGIDFNRSTSQYTQAYLHKLSSILMIMNLIVILWGYHMIAFEYSEYKKKMKL